MATFSVLASCLCALLLLHKSKGECVEGDIRLAGGSSYLEGRIEVCYAGVWGTVCDDMWDLNDAAVACKQLGFSSTDSLIAGGFFGQGSGPIVLDNLLCTGNESNILQCLRHNQCTHAEDAGVRCQNNDVALVYDGQLVANNSLISVDILTSFESISCVSTLPSCCNTTRAGNWFSPDSTAPLPSSPGTKSFYQSWTDSQTIQLHRSNSMSIAQEGLFRCDVPDAVNATQTFYVGIYSSSTNGALNITSLAYERSSHTLVCTSTGGPATSVTWSRDGVPLEVDGVTYQQSQVIVDTFDSIYENRLLLVNKSSVHSGLYGCRVKNSAGTAFDSTQLEVCRDDEVRLVIGEDSITSALEVCDEDNWQRSIEYPFRIPVTEPAPRNVQVQPHLHGFMVSWELPSSSGDILSQEVTCSDQSGLTISMTADQTSVSTVVPVTSNVPLECCVTTITRTPTIMGTLAAQTCAGSDLLPDTTDTTTPNQVSDDVTVEVLPPATQTGSQTLVFVLGGVAAVLFVTLVVVVILLVGLLLLHARSKKRHTVEEIEMNGGTDNRNGIAPSLDSKDGRGPVYAIVEPPDLPSRPTESTDASTSNAATRANVQNPMYTSIEDLHLRRTSFASPSRTSPASDALLRRNSTSALIGKRVAPVREDPIPNYSSIVPRHLRKKSSSPVEAQELDSSLDKSASPSDDNLDKEMYSKLQH